MNHPLIKSIMVLAIVLAVTYPLAAESKKKIAVMDFSTNKTDPSYGKIIRNQVEVALFKTGRFDIIEREKIDIVLRERGQGATDSRDDRSAAELGKILSVDYVVMGSIDRVDGYLITLKFVDIGKATLAYAQSARAADESGLQQTVEELAGRLVATVNGGTDQEPVKSKYQKYQYLWPCLGFLMLSATSFGSAIYCEMMLRDANSAYDQLADQYRMTTELSEVISLRAAMKDKNNEAKNYELWRDISLGIGAATIVASAVFLGLHLMMNPSDNKSKGSEKYSVMPFIMTGPPCSGYSVPDGSFFIGGGAIFRL